MRNGSFRAMGSEISWWAESDVGALLQSWFETVEACASRFRPGSELSRLNRAPQATIRIGPMLADLLRQASEAFQLSDGDVDAAMLDAVEAAGYDRNLEEARRTSVPPPGGRATWARFSLDGGTLTRPIGSRIDLGGIAKGWAAWKALEKIPGECLIDAAGDIAVRGRWSIAVEHAGEIVTQVDVEDEGVATSGIDRRIWAGGHHIINPQTGKPAVTDVVAATVIAEDTPTAETVARTIVIRGATSGLLWADGIPSVKGVIVTTAEGATLTTSRSAGALT